MRHIYLDNNATTEPSDRVLKAMSEAPWGNANSLHRMGIKAKIPVVDVEDKIKRIIGANGGYIYWTDGGSTANRLSVMIGNTVSTAVEHKSILQSGSVCTVIPVNSSGEPAHNLWSSGLQNRIAACMLVNNETGIIIDVSQVRKNAQSMRVHTDAVQALGKIEIDVDMLGVDTLSLSSHKIHGPKGIGCLWSRIELPDWYIYKPNTLNVPAIVGFGAALDAINPAAHHEHTLKLNREMICLLEEGLDGDFFRNSPTNSIPSTMNLRFPNVDAFFLTQALSDKGVYISMGSACNSGEAKPSHVLQAMGLTDEQCNESVRISFSIRNTIEEIRLAARELISCVKELRKS